MLVKRNVTRVFAFAVMVVLAHGAKPALGREELLKLLPSDAGPGFGGGFGRSVAISGDYIAVGAPNDTANSTGAVYVFKRQGTRWVEESKLTLPDAAFRDTLGYSVAMQGDVIVAGAPHADPASGWFGFASVFRRVGDTWVEEDRLVPSGSVLGDFFGGSADIDNGRIVVGAFGEDDEKGTAYVFRREEGAWVEEARLTASDGVKSDWFGRAVAMSGDRVIVGADRNAHAGDRSGAAYVFRRDALDWVEESKLTASDAGAGHAFGASVAITGELALVGAFQAPSEGGRTGAAYVFARAQAEWSEQARLIASDGAGLDVFGRSVALMGNLAVVGALGDSEGGSHAGAAYLFEYDGKAWVQEDKLKASDAHSSNMLGAALDSEGSLAVAGAAASAYVFLIGEYPPGIPTVSGWGMVGMGLLLLILGTVILRRLRPSWAGNREVPENRN